MIISLFKDMQKAGLVDSYSGYVSQVKGVATIMVDVIHKPYTITLFSDSPLVNIKDNIAEALNNTFLYSVKRSAGLTQSSLFGKPSEITEATYYASKNIVYTPEGIFLCERSWENDEELYNKVLGLSVASREVGVTQKMRDVLKDLGAVLLIKF